MNYASKGVNLHNSLCIYLYLNHSILWNKILFLKGTFAAVWIRFIFQKLEIYKAMKWGIVHRVFCRNSGNAFDQVGFIEARILSSTLHNKTGPVQTGDNFRKKLKSHNKGWEQRRLLLKLCVEFEEMGMYSLMK